MRFLSRTATDDDILAVARHWVDALPRAEYAAVFDALGYALAYQYDSKRELRSRALRMHRQVRKPGPAGRLADRSGR